MDLPTNPSLRGWSPVCGVWAPGPRLPSLPITPGMVRQESPPRGLWGCGRWFSGRKGLRAEPPNCPFLCLGPSLFSPFIRTPPSPVVGRIPGGPYGLVGTSWGPQGERRPHCCEWPPVSTGRSSWGEGRGVTSSEGASWKVRKQKQLGRNETSSPV